MNRKSYPTDITDNEWVILIALIPLPKPGGRPREQNMREIINAIFYIVRSGCSWRMLPHDFPNWHTVYYYFSIWKKEGVWEEMNNKLREQVRLQEGRNAQPSAAIIDSQSVKTTERGGESGYDAGKKVKGRKRHIVVDVMGLILAVVVHSASIQDRAGAKIVLLTIKDLFPSLKLIWADGAYTGPFIEWVNSICNWILEIVKRNSEIKGFYVLPRRWIVERTFGWFNKYRRLSKDYEHCPETSESMIYVVMINIMVRRLGRADTS